MLTLAINTATNLNELALFDDMELLTSKSWLNSKKNDDDLFQNLDSLFKNEIWPKKDWKRIFVLNGPGPFTSLRVGVVAANALSYALKIPVYGSNVFDFVKLTNAFEFFDGLILNASQGQVHVSDKFTGYRRLDLADFLQSTDLKKMKKCFVSLSNKNFDKFKSVYNGQIVNLPFAELLARLDFKRLKSSSVIEPEYFGEAI
ncbi:MAG: hypothetical protein UR28_C0021G0015 [Candidatus Peregrinibacteria bacterium GW2011_GWF2_33_10]|nr:MAG: hypothetical protein UR28_C0021G0015 [Candidatus Peregrinibacteria bacterium GW2011_GWF2_33_10]OGJ44374.1 MAG: tRNA (adenosine(37)-N6)-threonylcarbamoyltransferase complex dimerization subunit type 1 TsaB [Candidatus Peregrinibacteria bacterium RIFOXYA2_FULL_33_21]OGJ46391.1 MAG: tRNA (adenosine(37)-N6)-threonylcarbamoyltransferase complex dimerization subunit type 1 TsaB [Candidatus Peregrinibacteria bacterium RIFOXYA12_FULL_33_12]OGJ50169.1 MAG: tRNA (adenosine(37)-N6)-threonylcarbamoy